MALDVTAGPSCKALAVLLQQPTVAADQRIICSLLQVCKAWRAELRSTGAPTDIVVSIDRERLDDAAAAGGWLTKYPGLVRTLSISKAIPAGVFVADLEMVGPIREFFEETLLLAAEGGGTRWRLQSYQSDLGVTPTMLAALPAATLTRLDISASAVPESLANPLKLLTKLVDLAICAGIHRYAPAPVVAAIGTLRQLTKLSLDTDDPVNLQQLPQQLQQVALRCDNSGVVNLGHLTNLKQLELWADGIGPGSVLPAQLQHLTIDGGDDVGPVHVLGISSLQRLQCLTINSPISVTSQLSSLASMSQLHELHLHRQYGTVSMDCGRMWSNLTMLRSLGVYEQSSNPDDFTEVCRIKASATSISNLCLELELVTPMDVGNHDHDVGAGLHLCEHFKGLAQLKELNLWITTTDFENHIFGCLAELDVLHLTTMTGLTQLRILTENGLGDTDVCALAIALRHLQHLSLDGGRLSTAPLPCLGLLTDLHHLNLRKYSAELVDTGLRFLTSLTRLTHLELGGLRLEGPDVIDFIVEMQ